MAQALKHIILLAAVALMFVGCNNRPTEKQDKPVLSFEQVKAVEPSMLTTDEITRLVKNDTTHYKVVYFFDILCKPCLEHLRNELAAMYANRDTALWRFYLVAGFNWLHRLIPDSVGSTTTPLGSTPTPGCSLLGPTACSTPTIPSAASTKARRSCSLPTAMAVSLLIALS